MEGGDITNAMAAATTTGGGGVRSSNSAVVEGGGERKTEDTKDFGQEPTANPKDKVNNNDDTNTDKNEHRRSNSAKDSQRRRGGGGGGGKDRVGGYRNRAAKRNRKRPRSELRTNDGTVVRAAVVPLLLEGTPVVAAAAEAEAGGARCCLTPRYVRKVEPYPYTFSTYCKARWVGRTVLDVYANEFGSYPPLYYETAIRQGRILVSDQVVDPTYRLRGNDVLTHTVHRHEPCVAVSSDEPPHVRIVAETGTLLAVDKPPAIPIHACGGYHENSLMNLLRREGVGTAKRETQRGKEANGESNGAAPTGNRDNNNDGGGGSKLYTLYRLDRLTSGLLILAKTPAVATEWGTLIKDRNCDKLYVARVRGKFPTNADRRPNANGAAAPNDVRLARCGCPPSSSSSSSSTTATTSLPRLGKDDRPLPVDGVWPARNGEEKGKGRSNNNRDNSSHNSQSPKEEESECALRRRMYAHGYWITDLRGRLLSDMSLEEYATKSRKSVPEWLEQLDRTSKETTDESPEDGFYWFHVACPTRVEQPKIGVCRAGTFDEIDDETYTRTVKPSETRFALVRYDAATDSSVVLCRPQTGRTHQIRIHLQYMGHPIANDPNYGGDVWFQNPQGRRACEKAQAILDSLGTGADIAKKIDNQGITNEDDKVATNAMDRTDLEDVDECPAPIASGQPGLVTTDTPATTEEIAAITQTCPRHDDESMEDFITRTCVWCARNSTGTGGGGGGGGRGGRTDRAELEFLVRAPGIFLHALQYSIRPPNGDGSRISFRTDLPAWCNI